MMRILKYCWFHMVMVLTSWLPDVTPVLKLRGLLARPAFRKCGRNLQIARNVYIAFTNRLELGSDVYLAYGSWIQAGGGITMEDEVLLGPYVVLIAGDHSLQNGSYRFGPGLRATVHLGRGCWIGAHATVIKGTTVGQGALVAAGAVATCDVPDFAIVGGVPARILCADAREA